MANYWQAQHDQAVRDWLQADTTEQKNRIYNRQLDPVLREMAVRAQTAFGLHPSDDMTEDIVLDLYLNAFKNLNIDKILAVQNYFWICAKNFISTHLKDKKRYQTISIDELIHDSESVIMPGLLADTDAMHEADQKMKADQKRILDEIQRRLKAQTIFNVTNSVFMMLLRLYILENDFDVRGFGPYVRREMHLKESHFKAVTSRLKFKTMQFNEKITTSDL